MGDNIPVVAQKSTLHTIIAPLLHKINKKRLHFAFSVWSDLLTAERLRRLKEDRLLVLVEGVSTKEKFDAKFTHVSRFLSIKGFDDDDHMNTNTITF